MRRDDFRAWLARVDDLGAAQRREALAVLSGRSSLSASVAAVELGVDDERRCPRCQATGAVSIGRARGLRRYRRQSCGRTFNAATGTPLSGLHRKEQWLSFGASLSEGETVRAWAARRGLSREQVPVLAVTDRGGGNASATLPKVCADALKEALLPVIETDIVLVSDANRAYPPCAATLGVRHEALNMSAGERVRDAFHIQTGNSRHGRLKGFLRGFCGIATRSLDSYLRWFHLTGLAAPASPRACLTATMNTAYIRIAN